VLDDLSGSIPSESVNENLMHAVLYAALFFETSSDDECDPDLAVKQLEQIAWSLRELSHEEQQRFRTFARQAAERHPDPETASEIRSLVDALLGTSED
jgi:hypothetical protein